MDDVERVARAYASVMGFSFDKQMPDQQELLLKGTAAAMAATLELAAEAVENQRPVHHSFVRRTHAAAAIRAIGAR